jgi:hypothetical protein
MKSQSVRAVKAAAAQIDLALSEARRPVEELGESVGRIISGTASIRKLGSVDNHLSRELEDLCREAVRATVALQFYDRLTQHLTHLEDYLEGAGQLLATPPVAADMQAIEWDELRDRLYRRLISDLQRQCLLRDTGARRGDVAPAARPAVGTQSADSIELF